jgi:hypothetical protein
VGGDTTRALVERLTARLPQHAVAPSELTADKLAGLGFDREDIAVILNGIDAAAVREGPRRRRASTCCTPAG